MRRRQPAEFQEVVRSMHPIITHTYAEGFGGRSAACRGSVRRLALLPLCGHLYGDPHRRRRKGHAAHLAPLLVPHFYFLATKARCSNSQLDKKIRLIAYSELPDKFRDYRGIQGPRFVKLTRTLQTG